MYKNSNIETYYTFFKNLFNHDNFYAHKFNILLYLLNINLCKHFSMLFIFYPNLIHMDKTLKKC